MEDCTETRRLDLGARLSEEEEPPRKGSPEAGLKRWAYLAQVWPTEIGMRPDGAKQYTFVPRSIGHHGRIQFARRRANIIEEGRTDAWSYVNHSIALDDGKERIHPWGAIFNAPVPADQTHLAYLKVRQTQHIGAPRRRFLDEAGEQRGEVTRVEDIDDSFSWALGATRYRAINDQTDAITSFIDLDDKVIFLVDQLVQVVVNGNIDAKNGERFKQDLKDPNVTYLLGGENIEHLSYHFSNQTRIDDIKALDHDLEGIPEHVRGIVATHLKEIRCLPSIATQYPAHLLSTPSHDSSRLSRRLAGYETALSSIVPSLYGLYVLTSPRLVISHNLGAERKRRSESNKHLELLNAVIERAVHYFGQVPYPLMDKDCKLDYSQTLWQVCASWRIAEQTFANLERTALYKSLS